MSARLCIVGPREQCSASMVQYPPMAPEVLLQGIIRGLVYALIAAGLSLIFGLMEIVNFAPVSS
jgi:hypothetical protein